MNKVLYGVFMTLLYISLVSFLISIIGHILGIPDAINYFIFKIADQTTLLWGVWFFICIIFIKDENLNKNEV